MHVKSISLYLHMYSGDWFGARVGDLRVRIRPRICIAVKRRDGGGDELAFFVVFLALTLQYGTRSDSDLLSRS